MQIGVDFDNTLVCYDPVFHRLAIARGLVPRDLPPTKGQVRGYLRGIGREEAWTELQGEVYGANILEAQPFAGALEFVTRARACGRQVYIISHKTRRPVLGEPHDLHAAARRWLAAYGFAAPGPGGLGPDEVYLELTKEAKLARIGVLRCDCFIDDLPEFLAEPAFPSGVRRILFDPGGETDADAAINRATSWAEVEALLG